MDTGNRVMGISPGTRTVGIAILKNGKLREWQLKTFKGKWSKVKLAWVVSTLKRIISTHGITSIAVKAPDSVRTSKALNELMKAIYALAEKKTLGIECFTLKELEAVFAEGQKLNKRQMIAVIATLFPELKGYYSKIKKDMRSDYDKVFEAVGSGMITIE